MDYPHDKYRNLRRITTLVIGMLIVLPLAPIINRYVPPLMLGTWNFDLIVSVLVASLITIVIVRIFRALLIPLLVIFAGIVLYSQITNGRGFGSVINDYQVMVKSNWGKKEQKETDLVVAPAFFDGPLTRTVKAIEGKVDHRDSIVRNFAVKHSLENFNEFYPKYGNLVRTLSLFKYINGNFKYVPDAQRDEYFSTARETILNGMGGDCDDHSILMVSALQAIGARCRMVLTEGHLYPELYCGDDKSFDTYNAAILALFNKEVKGNIYYHEYAGEFWINLDYSAPHPGGPYVSEKAYAIISP